VKRGRQSNEGRGPWFLLTGLLIGLVIGVLYAWIISPAEYIDAAPQSLRTEAKDGYRLLIAQAYQANGDIGRARERLKLLGDADTQKALVEQAQRLFGQGGADTEARALAALASDLNKPLGNPTAAPVTTLTAGTATDAPTPENPLTPSATFDAALAIQTPTPQPSATATLTPTITPRPTFTALPTSGPPFELKDNREVCDPALPAGLLQVQVVDGAGEPVAGVRITVTWKGGQDSFFTGLAPEANPGYADFVMAADTPYSLQVGDNGDVVADLRAGKCSRADGSSYLGGRSLKFTQP